MRTVAVIAHRKKHLGGGLDELRAVLAEEGITEPLWHEVAPKRAHQVIAEGAELVLLWGGDGTVQRCVDVLAGSGAAVGILPAGAANLLAANLGIPEDLRAAVDIALHGRRRLDVGSMNGERFMVMAGAGFDALMMREADRGMKDRFGHLAYVWAGLRATRESTRQVKVKVDGREWFDGKASCVLVGNVSKITGGITAFDDARPDDGKLEVGTVNASGTWQWFRVLARAVAGRSERSPLVRTTRGSTVEVRFDRKTPYELDGGDRKPTKKLQAEVEPGAIEVCVPEERLG